MPLQEALHHLFIECDRLYRDGANILILTDKGVDESHMAIPSLLAVSALEHHLVQTQKKNSCIHHPRKWRAKRCSSVCMFIRLWGNGHLSLSGS